ncbi:DUF5694 domain-containing protein [Hymenobacter caeli]|uniref:TraB/GumN family protein n=1 Tax=Hymenobacter caeli TaxID=2735894 RepID=A0ABX2FW81_9BACT|nr:DUF5694 domain-containing protein [Hymenobacter caeli]NRT21232.1 hypothetical protein [Hymenobacter caeli]
MIAFRSAARLLLSLALLGPAAVASAQTKPAAPAKIKVYLVGTFHFDSSPTDVNHGVPIDMSTPEKQRELDELVGKLQKTQADKVFVEVRMDQQNAIDSTYTLYRKNQLKPRNGEVFQLGYRLADKLNRPRVYCADSFVNMDFEAAQAYAKLHGQEPIIAGAMAAEPKDSIGRLIAARTGSRPNVNALLGPGGTLLQRFIRMNTEATERAQMDTYLLDLARIGGGDNYSGADMGGDFFKRNVRIYTNLLRQVDVQHDRAIVLVIGQGHVAFLKAILKYNSLFEVADVVPLLTAK